MLACIKSEHGGTLQLKSQSLMFMPRMGCLYPWSTGSPGGTGQALGVKVVPLSQNECRSIGAASFGSPIICVSCLIDGFSLVLPLTQEPLRLKTLILFPGAIAGCRPWLAVPFPTNYPG